MELVDAKDYRVRENWLYFPELPLNPVQIPFGLGLAERPRLQLDHQGREITRLKVQIAGSWRPVLPAFSRRVAGVNRGAPTITIETGIADWQRSAARTLVARTHYLTPRGTGVILLARI